MTVEESVVSAPESEKSDVSDKEVQVPEESKEAE